MAKKKQAPTKTCPKCNTTMHAAKRQCPECGHQFANSKKTATKKATKGKKRPKQATGDLKDQLTSERGRILAEQQRLQDRLKAIETLLD